MPLQAQIHIPGMITLTYPFVDQVITSHVRLAGTVIIPDKQQLPNSIQFLLDQLPPAQHAQVLPGHILHGKKYIIRDLTYYMDGNAVRQIDYLDDAIRTYGFRDDYISNFYGDELSVGKHVFTIVVTAVSEKNPGITLFDSLDLPFVYSKEVNSVKPALDGLTPSAFLNSRDHQIIMSAFDYILTQRSEGALKNDIDFLGNLYDIDQIPAHLIPFLAKTIGYDYFAGTLGNGETIREELRFLPNWQKSVGTKESILVLLRALSLTGTITPLYLDLDDNTLVTGVKHRHGYEDETVIAAKSKQSRLTIPLTHASFVPQTIHCRFLDDVDTVLADGIWDLSQNKIAWQTFTSGWLTREDGSSATVSDIEAVYADASRHGITIVFTSAVKFTNRTRAVTTYQYEVDAKPGRNSRLSEFFDVGISIQEAPNSLRMKDYQHAVDIIASSKPFRTKMRSITLPAKHADAFVVNTASVSSTNLLSNPDRLSASNVPVTSVNLDGIAEEVSFTPGTELSDGFLFSWELDCNQYENRFGMFYSMAIEPSLHGQAFRDLIRKDILLQRGHAIIVGDDAVADKKRYLRPVNERVRNFTTAPACVEGTIYTGHYHTLREATPVSPAIQTRSDLLIGLDTEPTFTSDLHFFLDLLVPGGSRMGVALSWDGGSGLTETDLYDGMTTAVSFMVDQPTMKAYTGTIPNGALTGTPSTFALYLIKPTTEAEREAIWSSRSLLRNVTLELGRWYAIFDVAGNFYEKPIHISIQSPVAALNHQGTCCGCDLGVLNTNVPATFNKILGKTYQFGYEFDVEVASLNTNEIVAVYRWTSNGWITLKSDPELTVVLNPANTGLLTDDLIVAGSVTYVGPLVNGIGQQWAVRACPEKVGDRYEVSLNCGEVDDFSKAHVHRGLLGVIDDNALFNGIAWKDLIDHQHDQGGERFVAFEGFYLRGGVLRSCLEYRVTVGSQGAVTWDSGTWDQSIWDGAQQFQWDVDAWDAAQRLWDPVMTPATVLTVHHFPKRQVFVSA